MTIIYYVDKKLDPLFMTFTFEPLPDKNSSHYFQSIRLSAAEDITIMPSNKNLLHQLLSIPDSMKQKRYTKIFIFHPDTEIQLIQVFDLGYSSYVHTVWHGKDQYEGKEDEKVIPYSSRNVRNRHETRYMTDFQGIPSYPGLLKDQSEDIQLNIHDQLAYRHTLGKLAFSFESQQPPLTSEDTKSYNLNYW